MVWVCVRALQGMYEESIRTLQPHLGQHVIRYVFRIGRREIPHHIEDKLGFGKRRARLRQPLREGDLKFLAGRFLPQRNMTIVLWDDRVFAFGETCAAGLERERNFERSLGKGLRSSRERGPRPLPPLPKLPNASSESSFSRVK